MAKPNYAYEKRQRELAKKQKKEEKAREKAERKGQPGQPEGMDAAGGDTTPPAPGSDTPAG